MQVSDIQGSFDWIFYRSEKIGGNIYGRKYLIFSREIIYGKDAIIFKSHPRLIFRFKKKNNNNNNKNKNRERRKRETRSVCKRNLCGDTIYFRTCSLHALSATEFQQRLRKFQRIRRRTWHNAVRAVPFKRTRTNLARIALRRAAFLSFPLSIRPESPYCSETTANADDILYRSFN